MEFVIGLLIIALLGFILMPVLGGWLGLGLFLSTEKKAKKLEAELPDRLDALFDGRPAVTHTLTMAEEGLQGRLIEGAGERGYRLANTTQSGRGPVTLIFERAGEGSVEGK